MVYPTRLLGEWDLTRVVEDLLAMRSGRVRGVLRLQDRGDHIDWAESGVLFWDGARMPVERHYALSQQDGQWWAFFDDGRAFHPWRPGEWVEHLCGADRYRGLVTIEDSEHWRVVWDVRGPHKVQRLTSRLTSSRRQP